MISRTPKRESDLRSVAEAYLAGQVTVDRCGPLLRSIWGDLSRHALTAERREAWLEVLNLLGVFEEQTEEHRAAGPFDEAAFRALLASVLDRPIDDSSASRLRRARQIQSLISEILLIQWDPIGVDGVPEAADEYDAYVGPVYRLLASDAPAEEIARYLHGIELFRMGLPAPRGPESLMDVAVALRALDI